MSRNLKYYDYVIHDVLKDISGITAKPLFSGWGIYKNRKIFAIIIRGELYFKVNDSNRAEFEKRGSHSFIYTRKGRVITMPYWVLPEEILEDKEALLKWVNISTEIESK